MTAQPQHPSLDAAARALLEWWPWDDEHPLVADLRYALDVHDAQRACGTCGGDGYIMTACGQYGPPEDVPHGCPECAE